MIEINASFMSEEMSSHDWIITQMYLQFMLKLTLAGCKKVSRGQTSVTKQLTMLHSREQLTPLMWEGSHWRFIPYPYTEEEARLSFYAQQGTLT